MFTEYAKSELFCKVRSENHLACTCCPPSPVWRCGVVTVALACHYVTSCVREWLAFDTLLLLHRMVIHQTAKVMNETSPLPNMQNGGVEGTENDL